MKKPLKIFIIVLVLILTLLIGYLGNSLIGQRQQVDTRATQEEMMCPLDGATCEWDPVAESFTNRTTRTPTPSNTPTTIPATVVPTDATISPTISGSRVMYRVEVKDLTTEEIILARTTTDTKVNFTPEPDHEYQCSVSVVAECGTGQASTATNICRSTPSHTPTPTDEPTPTATPSATLTPTNTPTPTATPTSPPLCPAPNTCIPQLDCNLNGGTVQNGSCPVLNPIDNRVCCLLPNNSPTPTATPTPSPIPTATHTPVPPTNPPQPTNPPGNTNPPVVITQVIVNVTRVIVQNQIVQGPTVQQQQPQQQPQPQPPTPTPIRQIAVNGEPPGLTPWLVILAPFALILAGLAL